MRFEKHTKAQQNHKPTYGARLSSVPHTPRFGGLQTHKTHHRPRARVCEGHLQTRSPQPPEKETPTGHHTRAKRAAQLCACLIYIILSGAFNRTNARITKKITYLYLLRSDIYIPTPKKIELGLKSFFSGVLNLYRLTQPRVYNRTIWISKTLFSATPY